MKRNAVFGLVLVFALLLVGCVKLSDGNGNELTINRDQVGFYAERQGFSSNVEEDTMSALVKGSIYETGDQVSVFGTCLLADDSPADAVAVLSAWYPNGTPFITNDTMTEIQDGYFLHQSTMNVVQGTYLTEMTCIRNGTGEIARAFGEWQNPVWTNRLENISNKADNITIQIGNLSTEMERNFNITFDKINSTNATINNINQSLTQEIRTAADIANASVDRNDSYLAQLLRNITGLVTPVNNTGNVISTCEEDTSDLIYWEDWTIDVTCDDSSGKKLEIADFSCDITTTLSGTSSMNASSNNEYTYSEFINSGNDFNWNVTCVYN